MKFIRKCSLIFVIIFVLSSFLTQSYASTSKNAEKTIDTVEVTLAPTPVPESTPTPAVTPTQTYFTYKYDFSAANQAASLNNIGVNKFSYNPGSYTQRYGVDTTQFLMWSGANIFTDRGATDAYVQYKFDGNQVALYAEKGPYCGIAEISILDADGNVEIPAQDVDFYKSTAVKTDLAYTSPVLQPGIHQIKIQVSDKVNPNNNTVFDGRNPPRKPYWTINLYYINVTSDKVPTPTPKLTPTPTPISPTDPAYYEITPKPVTNRNPLIATTCVKIRLGSASADMAAVLDLVDRTAEGVKIEKGQYPDIIVLSEALLTRELGGNYAETVPGPYSNALALKCKQYNTYISFNILEQCADGKKRNAQVLLDRDGLIVGKYYKIMIPAEEAPFTTAGTQYSVFQTEFGKVGMMVCYDFDPAFNQQVAKGLKANGAELILAGSIGDYVQQAEETSSDNNIAVVIAGQDQYAGSIYPVSSIFNSNGELLAGITDRTAPYTGDNGYRPGAGSWADAYLDLGEYIQPSSSPTPTSTGQPTPQVTFPDVNDSSFSWAVNEVQTLATMGIINGVTSADGTVIYNPAAQITRAELTKLIVVAFNIDGSGLDASFTDVPTNSWYYDYIGKAHKNNIVNGTSATEFNPDAPITRQDMACIVIRAMVKYQQIILITDESKLNTFADKAAIADYAKSSVATAVEHNVIKGSNESGIIKFKPTDNANRAEAAVVIYRMLAK